MNTIESKDFAIEMKRRLEQERDIKGVFFLEERRLFHESLSSNLNFVIREGRVKRVNYDRVIDMKEF